MILSDVLHASDCTAVIDAHERLTHEQFLDRCMAVGDILDAYGTIPSDRIAVLSENSVPFLELYVGVPVAGRVIVPLNPRWSAPELRYALTDCRARLLFADRDVDALSAAVDHVVRLDTEEYDYHLHAVVSAAVSGRPDSDTLAGIFYTGGTTGAAKGVMLTHRNLMTNAETMRQIAPLDPDDTFLVMAPLFHAAGSTSVLYALAAGARQVTVPFHPSVVLDTIERERVTHTLAVPTMLAALVDEQIARPRDLSSLRVLMHGGAPITTALAGSVDALLPDTERVHLYGTTETSPIVTAQRHAHAESSSVGIPYGCTVLVDEGEVCVKGDNVMAGYWSKPDATAAVLRDGWYHTGDLGHVDIVGQLHILDRRNDLIITGGENVYPSEVETALADHPAVAEAAVFGRPDEYWGETVHAAIVTCADVTELDLLEHCQEHISSYKVPRTFTFLDALPKSAAGKVLRRELR